MKNEDVPLPFLEHLEELRSRLIICLIAVGISSLIAYNSVPFFLAQLIKPLEKVVFIQPTEAFWANIKVALFIGIYCALPLIFYQLWMFVRVGLKTSEKRVILLLTSTSFLLFTIGALFCYFVIIPLGIKFLMSYSQGIIIPMISVNSYLSFVAIMIYSFGIIFELPLAVAIITRAGFLTSHALKKYRRVSIVFIFVVGALLTPPDVFTQITLVLPLLVLYEISIFVAQRLENISKK